MVPPPARRHASATPRTPRSGTRTSTRSTSRPTTGRRCGRRCSTWSGSGSTTASGLPGGQPAHQAVRLLGVAASPASRRDHPDVIFLSEAFTRPEVMERLAKVGLHPVLHLLHLAQRPSGSSRRYLTELTQTRGGRLLPAQLLAQHPRHPDRAAADRRPGRLPRPAGPGGHARSPATASTGRPSSCRSTCRGSPAPRSTSTRRSTRSATGTSTAPTAWPRSSARVNQIRREHPALQFNDTLRFHRHRQRPAHRLLQDRADRPGRTRWPGRRSSPSSTSTIATPSRAGSTSTSTALGLDAGTSLRGARPPDRRPLPVGGASQLRRARPSGRAVPHLLGRRSPAPGATERAGRA